MNTRLFKTIGGASLAAFVAIAMTAIPAFAAPGYAAITGHRVIHNSATDTYTYVVTTAGKIPLKADSYINGHAVFGYAWLDTSTTPINAVVATIHPSFDDSDFSTGNHWHGHSALLGVENGHLCVQGLESPNFKIVIANNKLALTLSESDATVTSASAPTTSFVIDSSNNCNSGLEVTAPAP